MTQRLKNKWRCKERADHGQTVVRPSHQIWRLRTLEWSARSSVAFRPLARLDTTTALTRIITRYGVAGRELHYSCVVVVFIIFAQDYSDVQRPRVI